MFDFPNSPTVGQIYSPSSGQQWQWDGQAWVNAGLLATASIIDRIYLTGVSTWTKPAGLAYAEVEGVAAGGPGAPAIVGGAAIWSFGSAGGGGAWGKKLFQAADLPASVTITVGASGTPPSNGNAPASANSTFGSLITLPGGGGGRQGSNAATSTYSVIAGGDGGATPTGVDLGNNGENADYSMVGMSAAGGGTFGLCGRGGGSPWGWAVQQTITTGQSGINGVGYGSGGGGTVSINTLRVGGYGAPGFFKVREFYAQLAAPTAQATAEARNRIINGSIQISQAAAGAAVISSGSYPADMFLLSFLGPACNAQFVFGARSKYGSLARLRSVVTTPKASLAAGDYYSINHYIEGYQVADLMQGSATGVSAVLRFGFRGPAGTYAVGVRNADANRSFVKTFTVSAGEANTDVERTISIPPCPDGTWNGTSPVGMSLNFQFAAGTTFHHPSDGAWATGNYVGHASMSNGAAAANTFEIFDIGLYRDPNGTGVAPPWISPSFGEELTACQRYYYTTYNYGVQPGTASTSSMQAIQRTNVAAADYHNCRYATMLRTPPTITIYSPYTGAAGKLYNLSAAADVNLGSASGGTSSAHLTWTAAVGHPYCYHLVADARM